MWVRVGEQWGGIGSRERPRLYNVSWCFESTDWLHGCLWWLEQNQLCVCVFVCGLQSEERGEGREEGGHCYLVPISANPKGPHLPPLSVRWEPTPAKRAALWCSEVIMEKGGWRSGPAPTSADFSVAWVVATETALWCIQDFNRQNICSSADLWESCAWHNRWCCITNI